MTAMKWYQMTHDNTGSRYGWIIGKEQNGGFVTYFKGFSRERFLNAAEMIIASAADPSSFLVINTAGKGTTYRLTDVFYAARHSGFLAMENVFKVA